MLNQKIQNAGQNVSFCFLYWRSKVSEHNNNRVILTQAESPSSTVSWLCWSQKPLGKCLRTIQVYMVPQTMFRGKAHI